MGGEVVEDDADALGFWEVDIDKLAHAKGEVVSGAMTRDLAPRAVGVKEDEEVDDAVAAILVVEAPSSRPGAAGGRLARCRGSAGWGFRRSRHRPLWVRLLGIEVEHIFHPGDVLGVDLGDAPHVLVRA